MVVTLYLYKSFTMAAWVFESGHSEVSFKARHMMVSWVRGSFKNIEGKLEFDKNDPAKSFVELDIDASTIWTGAEDRDEHLRSPDFLDVENHPKISFKSKKVELLGENTYKVTGDLTIRGITNEIVMDVQYLGEWDTPWWEDGQDKGPKTRAGFTGKAKINRHDFKVDWQSQLGNGGVVVSPDILITLDIEAILQD